MAPVFLNQSCDPFTTSNHRCIIGNYVQYTVNVSKPDHVINTIKFAKKHNIRFVVRNTGHDYMGKSTGAGGIAVWMHHLTGRTWYSEYNASDTNYHGPAVTAHAGVLGDMLVEDAERRGLVILTGVCPSVGFAGGYIQGGGHSILGSLYGMAADQVLAFEVITTDGEFVRASQTINPDLFWALRGGGGGTYGIVWSVTVKAHPNTFVTSLRVLYRPSSKDPSLNAYWEGINYFLSETPKYVSVGAYRVAVFDNITFQTTLFFPGKIPSEVKEIADPWLKKLQTLEIDFEFSRILRHSTVRSSIATLNEMHGGEIAVGTSLFGARFLPRYLWESKESQSKLYETLRGIVNDGGSILDLAIDFTLKNPEHQDNAVLPAFRSMRSMCMVALTWNDTANWGEQFAETKKLTTLAKRLEGIAPHTGAYLNEADPFDPDWKRNFYGENYARLLRIKDKWDPDEMLYGNTAVGGDRWSAMEDGRLCRRTGVDFEIVEAERLQYVLALGRND